MKFVLAGLAVAFCILIFEIETLRMCILNLVVICISYKFRYALSTSEGSVNFLKFAYFS